MPSLPLALPASLATPDPAVQTADDVLAVYPRQFRTDEHPVLDAINEAHAGIHRAYTGASDYAASQSDILRANGEYLDGLLGDHGCYRAPGERDDDYRARGFAWLGVVTPESMVAVINDLLALYTITLAQCCETIADRWYVEDGAADWGSFVNTYATLNGPSYPDRLYPGDAALNDGASRPQSDPGEPLIFLGDAGRQFFLRVPALNDADGPTSYACNGSDDPPLVNILLDGDCEAAGVTAWTVVNAAHLIKSTIADPYAGQWLQIVSTGTADPGASQTCLEPGKWYWAMGVARGDGLDGPVLYHDGVAIWTGTTSYWWQPFSVVFQATATDIVFGSAIPSGVNWVGYDSLAVYELNLPAFPVPMAGMFVETGTATVEMSFVSRDYLIADETYNAIIQAMNRIKGHGIRWEMVIDPRLV